MLMHPKFPLFTILASHLPLQHQFGTPSTCREIRSYKMPAHTHAQMRTCTRACRRAHTQASTETYQQTRTRTRARAHTHTHTTHTHTHTFCLPQRHSHGAETIWKAILPRWLHSSKKYDTKVQVDACHFLVQTRHGSKDWVKFSTTEAMWHLAFLLALCPWIIFPWIMPSWNPREGVLFCSKGGRGRTHLALVVNIAPSSLYKSPTLQSPASASEEQTFSWSSS